MKDVENEILDLFCSLECDDSILDYPIYYCSAKDAWAVTDMGNEKKDVSCLLDGMIDHIPAPKIEANSDFKMLVSQIESNQYFGKMLIGMILIVSLITEYYIRKDIFWRVISPRETSRVGQHRESFRGS